MPVRDPIVELHDTRLYMRLKELSEDYAQRITTFLSEIAPLLETTARFFPYYTRHDANHGYQVIRRIEQILTPGCFNPQKRCALGATELFLLIASAYAHDLGMIVFPGEEGELAKSLSFSLDPGWETNTVLQDYLRKHHSKRGGEYIARNVEKLRAPINLVEQLNWMMKSHNFTIPELDKNLSDSIAAEQRVIDLRQLSIILCIADAIEFSDTRVIDGVLDLISRDVSEAARESYRENMKHAYISDGLAIRKDGRIVVSGSFRDPEVLSLAHHNLDQIEEWIREYCDIDRRSEVRRLRVRPELLLRNLELSGARFERLGVRMSKKNVIDLISSNAVWRLNIGAPVRELIQNSVEACRYRNFHSARADRYVPAISVIFSRRARTITIQDNGCGMPERVVLNNLLTVGNSRATEKTYASEDYAPTARFGIGFWSVFTIAERARIETLAFEEAGNAGTGGGIEFEIELGDLKDYTVFSYKESTAGTTVTIHLKSEVIVDEVFEQVRKQLLCSEIEVTLSLDDDKFKLPTVTPSVSDEYLLEAKLPRKKELEIETFKWSGTLGNTDLALSLVYQLLDGHASFVDDSRRQIMFLGPPRGMSGGEVPDTLTGRELADAYSNYPDLLCFKLIPVRLDADVRLVEPEYLTLSELAKRSGIIWVIQNHYLVPVGGGKFSSFYDESLLPFAYLYATRVLNQFRVTEDTFVVESHRLASMLFDCDPSSTVEFFKALLVPGKPAVDLCIQRISLGNVRFTGPAEGILTEIQGRWTGAIYLRDFVTPNGKPYVFLGRSRVLIQKSSRLRSHLEDLKAEGRLIKLAETIALLQDDEAGFTPAAVADLL